jgi:hypothetical protein
MEFAFVGLGEPVRRKIPIVSSSAGTLKPENKYRTESSDPPAGMRNPGDTYQSSQRFAPVEGA